MSQAHRNPQLGSGRITQPENDPEAESDIPEVLHLPPLSRTRMSAKVLQVRTPPFIYVADEDTFEA